MSGELAACLKPITDMWRVSSIQKTARRTGSSVKNALRKPPDFDLDFITGKNGETFLDLAAVFASDIHMGINACRAKMGCRFFDHTNIERLILVGDNVSGDDMRQKEEWNLGPWQRQLMAHMLRAANNADGKPASEPQAAQSDILIALFKQVAIQSTASPAEAWQKIQNLAKQADQTPQKTNARVVNMVGNHDIAFAGKMVKGRLAEHRRLVGKVVCGIPFALEGLLVHKGLNKILRVFHGHQFDEELQGEKSSSYKFGDKWYSRVNRFDEWFQNLPKCEGISPAAFVKKLLRNTILNRLKTRHNIIAATKRDETTDGSVCGHLHMDEINKLPNGRLYLNDGSWTDHVQVLAISKKGQIALLTWHRDRIDIEDINGRKQTRYWKDLDVPEFNSAPKIHDDQYTKLTDRLARILCRMFPPLERQRALKERQEKRKNGEELMEPFLPLPATLRGQPARAELALAA